MENQTGRKIRVLKSDNGGEYTSKEFDGYYTQEGIRRQLTVPYTPEQNGVAERKNKSPHSDVGNMTPKERFTGKKPEVSHFRIFGSLTYSHVPSNKTTKLEATAEKGIFVGYDETSKAFCIYLPS